MKRDTNDDQPHLWQGRNREPAPWLHRSGPTCVRAALCVFFFKRTSGSLFGAGLVFVICFVATSVAQIKDRRFCLQNETYNQ